VVIDIKEALAALDELKTLPELRLDEGSDYLTLRRFVESVAQEREDWATVEAWLAADEARYQASGAQYAGGWYYTVYPDHMRHDRYAFYGKTPAEALNHAAAFCRAEMGSKT
jgi:hypothetical protein